MNKISVHEKCFNIESLNCANRHCSKPFLPIKRLVKLFSGEIVGLLLYIRTVGKKEIFSIIEIHFFDTILLQLFFQCSKVDMNETLLSLVTMLSSLRFG